VSPGLEGSGPVRRRFGKPLCIHQEGVRRVGENEGFNLSGNGFRKAGSVPGFVSKRDPLEES